MLSRTSQFASAILLSACFAGAALAQTPAAPAKTPTPQQQRMADCNKSAEGKKGDERKAYMSSCLKGEASPAKQLTPQQQKMKDCNAKAGEQKLTGDQRKTFMSSCLKAEARPPGGKAAAV